MAINEDNKGKIAIQYGNYIIMLLKDFERYLQIDQN